jgi:hypothetical protein
MIERITGGARRQSHSPGSREVSLTMDKPWEGNAVNYVTVFQDGGIYRGGQFLSRSGSDSFSKLEPQAQLHGPVALHPADRATADDIDAILREIEVWMIGEIERLHPQLQRSLMFKLEAA